MMNQLHNNQNNQKGLKLSEIKYSTHTFLIQDFLGANAQKIPDASMIYDHGTNYTYRELDIDSNRLARILVMHGVSRGDRVAFYMEKNINAFRSLFGILKADATYVPLDYNSPFSRTISIINDCKCKFLICDSSGINRTLAMLTEVNRTFTVFVLPNKSVIPFSKLEKIKCSIKIIRIDNLDKYDGRKREYENTDIDLAYIMYTSGSTGIPKGIMISHKSVIDYANWTVEHFCVKPEDRLTSHAQLHFDLSVFDVYTACFSGASLYLLSRNEIMFPINFLKFLNLNNISIICAVPSFFTFCMNVKVLGKVDLPTLRVITFCGEVMPTSTIIEWMTAYPEPKYTNQYGPAETTCASTYYDINEKPNAPAKPLPIGIAIPNTEIILLNDSFHEVQPGEIGEIYVRGTGNGLGYWNNREKTKNVFIQNPLHNDFRDIIYKTGDLGKLNKDNLYEFCGRKDSQIKYMGHRIELDEIENALQSINYITANAVIAIEDKKNKSKIITAFICIEEKIDFETIKKSLNSLLPNYMIPKKFIRIKKMQYNANGKIDKLRLEKEFFKGDYHEIFVTT